MSYDVDEVVPTRHPTSTTPTKQPASPRDPPQWTRDAPDVT